MSAPLHAPVGGGRAHLSPWRWVALLLAGIALVGILALAGGLRLVKWPPKQGGTTISGPKTPGKVAKPLTPAQQLASERTARKAAEAKVRELRRVLRAKTRRPAAPSVQKHQHIHSGRVRLELVAPTYPIIPEPTRR